MSDAREILLRLKRRPGRERSRYWRLYEATSAGSASRERAFGEANTFGMAMGFVDAEIRKLKGTR